MTKKRRTREAPRAAPREKVVLPARRPHRARIGITVVIALALAFLLSEWWRTSNPRRGDPPSPLDSLAGLDGPAALQRGIARVQRGERLRSLPYFEHALERGTGRDAEVVALYAATLQDVALDSTMRSSVERTRTLLRALSEIERIASRTADAEQHAEALFQHSYLLRVMGFPVDALVELNAAGQLLPGEPVIDEARYGLALRLETPNDPSR
jgi:hypothetical protein